MAEHRYYLLRVYHNGEVHRLPFACADGAEGQARTLARRRARELAGKGAELLSLEYRTAPDLASEGELIEQLPLPGPEEIARSASGRGGAEQDDSDLMGEGTPITTAAARTPPAPASVPAMPTGKPRTGPLKVGDPVAIVNSLRSEDLKARIRELDGERAALAVLLAAAEAREGVAEEGGES